MEYAKHRMQNGADMADVPEGMGQEDIERTDAADLDAVLKDRSMQSEFDRRISKALETARSKWEQEAALRSEQSRAQALESAREQAAMDYAQREDEISRRELDIRRRELKNEALAMLAQRDLPAELAEMLPLEDAETMKRTLELAEHAFREAIRRGMAQRMTGMYPEIGAAPLRSEDMDDDSYYRTNYLRKNGGNNA